MTDELTEILELATREPGYGPDFYRCLLNSEVYALLPAEGNGLDEGKARFIMWNDQNGARVIPFFSSVVAVGRVLTDHMITMSLKGRDFLRLTQGADVVLNPNESASCRLSASEVACLLDTGAVVQPRPADPREGGMRAILAVEHPPTATLQSLCVLFARHPTVLRAYVALCWPPEQPERKCYLVAVRMDRSDVERLVQESALVMNDVPPDLAMDLMVFDRDDHDFLQAIVDATEPFYDRTLGERLVMPANGRVV